MNRTTIAIKAETCTRITAGADSESMTIDAFLQALLDEYEQGRFWASFRDLTPESYTAAVISDGDALDEGYAIEDRVVAIHERC
ncbi:MAG: hypothetical protein ACRCYX_01100 [Dermatophilaceae bacterium]